MSQDKNPAPHTCGDCGEPAYHGFNMPGKCVQFGCAFYDAGLFAEWAMWLPDVDDSDIEDEETQPYITLHVDGQAVKGYPVSGSQGFGTPLLVDPDGYAKDAQLDAVGQLLGVARFKGENDYAYRNRLTDFYRKAP